MANDTMELTVCIGCGCDDLHGCRDPIHKKTCYWLVTDGALGVCSACRELAEAFIEGDRTLHIPKGTQKHKLSIVGGTKR